MSNTFVAVAYDDMYTALEVRLQLLRMQKEYLLDLDDAVVAVRDDKGKVKLHQIHNMTAAGAVSGSFWGLLIGLIFMNPLLGLAAGAAGGMGRPVDVTSGDAAATAIGSAADPTTAIRASAARVGGSDLRTRGRGTMDLQGSEAAYDSRCRAEPCASLRTRASQIRAPTTHAVMHTSAVARTRGGYHTR